MQQHRKMMGCKSQDMMKNCGIYVLDKSRRFLTRRCPLLAKCVVFIFAFAGALLPVLHDLEELKTRSEAFKVFRDFGQKPEYCPGTLVSHHAIDPCFPQVLEHLKENKRAAWCRERRTIYSKTGL